MVVGGLRHRKQEGRFREECAEGGHAQRVVKDGLALIWVVITVKNYF